MHGAVFSWFFPPETSAEGLVTYKLLKGSIHQYDVYGSSKAIWGYSAKSECTSSNIKSYLFNAKNFSDWKSMCLNLFYLKQNRYDFIMSRSMPPESHEIALAIKNVNPNLFWIASFGDPLSFNPYELTNIIKSKKFIPKSIQKYFLNHPRRCVNLLDKFDLYRGNVLLRMLHLEKKVFEKADLLIFPNIQQCKYSLNDKYEEYKDKCLIIPHSYDLDMMPKKLDEQPCKDKRFTFLYTGHLDEYRNPETMIQAYERIKVHRSDIAKRIRFVFVGNMPQIYKNEIYIKNLYKSIVIHEPVDYYSSLKMMQKADCLLHIDAKFNYKYNTNIFFASKLADYMGNFKPILGITAEGSPAFEILRRSHNRTHEIEDVTGMTESIIDYVNKNVVVDYSEYEKYNSILVAKKYDDFIEKLIRR